MHDDWQLAAERYDDDYVDDNACGVCRKPLRTLEEYVQGKCPGCKWPAYLIAPMPTAKGKRRASARKKTWASERARKRVAKQSSGLKNRRIKRMD